MKVNSLNCHASIFLAMSKSLMPVSINFKVEKAVEIIGQFDGVIVALSAGVDSSLVAHLARRALGDRAVAVTAVSESLPQGEIEIAKKVAGEIGIRHLIVHTDEIHNPNCTSNPTNRCYYCKETLYRELAATAADLGFQTILDGTHLDDLFDDRPGLQAAQEARQVFRRGFPGRRVRHPDRPGEIPAAQKFRLTGVAGREVSLHPGTLAVVQRPVDIPGQQLPCVLMPLRGVEG